MIISGFWLRLTTLGPPQELVGTAASSTVAIIKVLSLDT